MGDRQKVDKHIEIAEMYPDNKPLVMPPEFNDALIGVVERCGQEPFVVYDMDKVVAVNMEQGMSEEEAREFFDFNQAGAWQGDGTPGFLLTIEGDADET